MSDARVLAELMGWKLREIDTPRGSEWWWISLDGTQRSAPPNYPTDLNALAEVWKVLKERGLWDEFEQECCNKVRPSHAHDWVYRMLMDGKGQIKAAIKVFKEAQG